MLKIKGLSIEKMDMLRILKTVNHQYSIENYRKTIGETALEKFTEIWGGSER